MRRAVDEFYEFGEFQLDVAERLLRRGDKTVPLTVKAFETLLALVRRAGHLVEKDELMKQVWPDSFVQEVNLARNIWTLRKALGEDEGQHRYIETVPKLGYRFVAPVADPPNEGVDVIIQRKVKARILTESSSDDLQSSLMTGPSVGARSEIFVNKAHAEGFLAPGVIAVWLKRNGLTLLIGAAALASIMVWVSTIVSRRQTPATAEAIDSIAVLPFLNASSDPDVDYLSDGITENIVNSLSQIPGLRVVPRTTMSHYKGLQVQPELVGKELGVRAILLGRINKHGDDLSVQTELIDVARVAQLWGEQFDRKMSELPSLQQEISQQLATSLRVKLGGEETTRLAKRTTAKPEAYHAYLKGRYFWNKRTAEGYQKGIEYFRRAIDIDPGYAAAYAGLADCYNLLSEYDLLSPDETLPKAREAALKALALDDTVAEAHTSMAHILMYYDWDWQKAQEEFRKAIELDSNYSTAHQWYAEYLTGMGRFDEAMPEMRRALELEPTSIMLSLMIGWVSLTARNYDAAIEQYQRTLEMDPQYAQTHFALATAYRLKGMYPESVAEFQKWAALTGKSDLLETYLADVYAGWGKQREARKALRRLEERSKHHYVPLGYLAYIYASLGDEDRAFQSLEKLCEERVGVLFLKTDPRLDSLRSDPRFALLLRHVKLAS